MTSDSKIFVSLRPIRKIQPRHQEPSGPNCQWDGCEQSGTHRAPVGREAEGLFLLFCPTHLAAYTKGYNFSPSLSDPVTARYQREAASGLRATIGVKVNRVTEPPLPSKARSGSAKAINARKSAAERQAASAAKRVRKLKVLEAKAFETLGISPDATPEEIRRRYKEKLKMHHPDANQGDRNSEDELRAAIEAHKILKLNGFC
ncbi:J domain-containing protein [Neorhizobium sp. T7_12]|uniref:J domain-containing protein n=1 Tax=Neorhizobium sp. T7_12 TaxID=2093832 RepID=UPI000CFA0229|nr:J domain-containing protein [Neorhizobium sp. T7_12]